MTWFLMILGILILLAALLSRIRLGVRLTWAPGDLTAEASIGPVRIRLYPPVKHKKENQSAPTAKETDQPQQKKAHLFPEADRRGCPPGSGNAAASSAQSPGAHQAGHPRHAAGNQRHSWRGRGSRSGRAAVWTAPYGSVDRHAGRGTAGAYP